MSVEANKAIARRYFEELLNKGNLAVADEILATKFIVHSSFQTIIHGLENAKQSMAGFRAAFPDQHFTIEDEIGEGDSGKAARSSFVMCTEAHTRANFRASHAVAGIAIYQITAGKAARSY